MTKEQWASVRDRLCFTGASVKLLIDGYSVSIVRQRMSELKDCYVVYVNGWLRGEWLLHDCEERRRFYRPKEIYAHRAKMRRLLKKLPKKYGGGKSDQKVTYYRSDWSSFDALRLHLVKNNQSIELATDAKTPLEKVDHQCA